VPPLALLFWVCIRKLKVTGEKRFFPVPGAKKLGPGRGRGRASFELGGGRNPGWRNQAAKLKTYETKQTVQLLVGTNQSPHTRQHSYIPILGEALQCACDSSPALAILFSVRNRWWPSKGGQPLRATYVAFVAQGEPAASLRWHSLGHGRLDGAFTGDRKKPFSHSSEYDEGP